jgi:small subunit ribosomal protein S1
LIGELKEGEVRTGRVSSICDFGAFVDIGGADGLVHLSELSWSRVRHPSEVLKVGQEVEVYVLGINAQEKKIALSIKRTQAEPWSRVAAKYEVGQLVRGTVTQLANFGAFARIEDGIEGLIHVSEIADDRVTHPKQAVKEGQDLLLRIIRIDPQRRRMGLSLRRALDTPDEELIAVFGEGIVEEKERIIQELRDALAVEGIELNLSGAPALDENGEAIVEAPAEGSGEASEEQAAKAAPVEATPRTFREEQPRPEKKERVRKERPATGVPAEIRDEPMSAMELAFAMAGAQADLEKEAADAENGDDEE